VNTSLQVLFIERCLQLLKEGGRLGIVLPESLFGNPSYRYVMQYLEENTRMESIIAMPEELFQPYTHAKTCVLIAKKDTLGENEDHHIFMAAPEWCGHDSRGNPTTREDSDGVVRLLDDLPLVEERYDSLVEEGDDPVQDHFGFLTHSSKIDNKIYVPRYYAPDFEDSFESLSETHNMVKFGELLDEGLISMSTGVEVGKMAYGTGDIPFIRTSDMANWETKINPQHCVSKEIYEEYNEKADVQAQDILLVKDGTSLIGTTCMISDYDTKMLYQSHIYKIRVEDRGELSPYELFAAFNHPVVTEQIKARQFTQQIIDSLSKERLREVVLPIPSEEETRQEVISKIRNIVETRAELKQEARMVLNGEI
jgi:type I restriction enzyme M protein